MTPVIRGWPAGEMLIDEGKSAQSWAVGSVTCARLVQLKVVRPENPGTFFNRLITQAASGGL